MECIKDLNEYQRLAVATMNPEISDKDRLGNVSLGLCGETFELFELFHHVKTHDDDRQVVYEPPPYDSRVVVDIVEELGDVMWYIAALVEFLDGKLNDVCSELFVVLPWDTLNPADIRCADTFYASWVNIGVYGAKIAEKVKKFVYQGHDMDDPTRHLIFAYAAKVVSAVITMAAINGKTLSEVCHFNIVKLRKRYPDGQFSAEASVNRTV